MTLIGLLTLLSLASSSNGLLTGGWLALLGKGFGWGMYLLPLGLIGVGVWLVLRHFDRLPQLSPERIIGLALLYFNLLAWMHFFSFPADRAANFLLADQAGGGGYAGGAVLALLRPSLGWAGSAVVLVAWMLIALALTLDLSVPELFAWISPLLITVTTAWEGWLNRKTAPSQLPVPPRGPAPPAGDYASGPAPRGIPPVSASGLPARTLTDSPEPHTWALPPIDQILESGGEVSFDDELNRQRARLIEDTLASFGAPATVVETNRGPTI
ncbi:MAG TPA: DNA translocase FtsK 4TM domain-containing protein, partial [Anaerolineales bacterium]|nr:DNA translocase FtsK 4TM domain-containing protein [Anaerolineales bacterium]